MATMDLSLDGSNHSDGWSESAHGPQSRRCRVEADAHHGGLFLSNNIKEHPDPQRTRPTFPTDRSPFFRRSHVEGALRPEARDLRARRWLAPRHKMLRAKRLRATRHISRPVAIQSRRAHHAQQGVLLLGAVWKRSAPSPPTRVLSNSVTVAPRADCGLATSWVLLDALVSGL